jgi:mono/diheme cytochrome c family protein
MIGGGSMRRIGWTVLMLSCAFGGASPQARAADTASGREVARKLCVNCHIVEPDGAAGTVNPAIPSFMAIADKEGQSESNLHGFILNPHPPMPEIQLTTHELENIAAYILSLKGKP